jgi:flagellar biosynthesis protein FlhG
VVHIPMRDLSAPEVARVAESSLPRHVSVALPSALMHSRHRAWSLGLPLACGSTMRSAPLIIAVGGGKGGVGKSMISANVAAGLARSGFRVAAIDMDCGGSNLHTYFGMKGVRGGLAECVVHDRARLEDLLVSTQIPNLSIITNQQDDAWSVADSLQNTGLSRFWDGLQTLGDPACSHTMDIIVLDLGAGTARHTIDLFCLAHVGVITSLPEPTSVENSYMFLKTTLLRLLENAGHRLNMSVKTADVLRVLTHEPDDGGRKSYTDKLRFLYQSSPSVVGPIAAALAGRAIGIIVNQTRSQADIDIGKAMEMASQNYFGYISSYLGYLNYDEAAWKSLRNKRLLSLDFPQALITRRLDEIVSQILVSAGIVGV